MLLVVVVTICKVLRLSSVSKLCNGGLTLSTSVSNDHNDATHKLCIYISCMQSYFSVQLFSSSQTVSSMTVCATAPATAISARVAPNRYINVDSHVALAKWCAPRREPCSRSAFQTVRRDIKLSCKGWTCWELLTCVAEVLSRCMITGLHRSESRMKLYVGTHSTAVTVVLLCCCLCL